jgi:hypothetical protein
MGMESHGGMISTKDNSRFVHNTRMGRAMSETVSRRHPNAEGRVHPRVSPYGICGGQSGTGTGQNLSSSVFPVSIIPPGLHTHIYHLGKEQ